MKKITVHGGRRLLGSIRVSGSKNAALPILFSTIITNGVSEISNLPDITDVTVALQLLSSFGAKITRGENTAVIDTRELHYSPPDESLVSSIRASTYLIGASLSRFGECRISAFGGCNFGVRPIDLHLYACERLGGSVVGDTVFARRLRGGEINLAKQSVGATVNSIILAAAAEGESVIRGFAREPHIDALIDFLVSAGADINVSSDAIRIKGRELHGGKATVIGDMIEAGTYLAAGLVTGGRVEAHGVRSEEMRAQIELFLRLGARVDVGVDCVGAALYREPSVAEIIAAPYPAFPTDMQPIATPLLAYCLGGSITDTVWQTRFAYLDSLSAFGIRSYRRMGFAFIEPSRIRAAEVFAPDLRGGAACLLAALSAGGVSIINNAELILRGYEKLEDKLRSLGAVVKIEDA